MRPCRAVLNELRGLRLARYRSGIAVPSGICGRVLRAHRCRASSRRAHHAPAGAFVYAPATRGRRHCPDGAVGRRGLGGTNGEPRADFPPVSARDTTAPKPSAGAADRVDIAPVMMADAQFVGAVEDLERVLEAGRNDSIRNRPHPRTESRHDRCGDRGSRGWPSRKTRPIRSSTTISRRNSAQAGAAPPRDHPDGGFLVMLIASALLAAALAFPQAREARPPETDQTVTVTRGARLTIDNFAGEVIMNTWDRDQLRVQARHPSRTKVDIKNGATTVAVLAHIGRPWLGRLRGSAPRHGCP